MLPCKLQPWPSARFTGGGRRYLSNTVGLRSLLFIDQLIPPRRPSLLFQNKLDPPERFRSRGRRPGSASCLKLSEWLSTAAEGRQKGRRAMGRTRIFSGRKRRSTTGVMSLLLPPSCSRGKKNDYSGPWTTATPICKFELDTLKARRTTSRAINRTPSLRRSEIEQG